jgi:SlyX protein
MNERLEQLELKLAFLERANQELSDVVYRQQQELDDLRARLAVLAARVDTMKVSEATEYTPEQEKPPHY